MKRMSVEWIQMVKHDVCPGCRDNRYNLGQGYRESENDAVVTCDYCWSLPTLPYYNHSKKRWECHGNFKRFGFSDEKIRR